MDDDVQCEIVRVEAMRFKGPRLGGHFEYYVVWKQRIPDGDERTEWISSLRLRRVEGLVLQFLLNNTNLNIQMVA